MKGVHIFSISILFLCFVVILGCISTESTSNSNQNTMNSSSITTSTLVSGNSTASTTAASQDTMIRSPVPIITASPPALPDPGTTPISYQLKHNHTEAIRAFIENYSAIIVYKENMTTSIGKELEIYKMGKDEFYVDADSGQVVGASFSTPGINTGSYSPVAAQAVALGYARKHYPSFSNRKMVASSNFLNHGDAGLEYSFTWREQWEGINDGNVVQVSVNPEGKIMSYHAFDGPVPHAQPPKISREEANSTAIAYVIARGQISNITSITSSPELALSQPDRSKVIWNVVVKIHYRSSFGGYEDHSGGIVQIEGMNGTVLNIDPMM